MQLRRDDILMLLQEAKKQLLVYELSLVKFNNDTDLSEEDTEKIESRIRRLRIVMFELETEYAKR